MQIIFYYFLLITVSAEQSTNDVYDKLIPKLHGKTSPLPDLIYDTYSIVFSSMTYFMRPLTENMTKTIKGNETIGNNIWMTLYCQNLYLVPYVTGNIIFYRHVFFEFDITEIKLGVDDITNKVLLKNLTITSPSIDNYWPFMTTKYLNDFQYDKSKQFITAVNSILKSFINELLSNIYMK